ncbi:MAG: hypothetical protein AABZ74_12080 [Cyanobacteriota bacterium]
MHINWGLIRKPSSRIILLDIIMLFIALINLASFSFDFTYITLRNFYFNYIPFVISYDAIKGMEPHDFTKDYLEKADVFFNESYRLGSETDPNLTPSYVYTLDQKKVDELINLSFKMIDEDPFKPANKSGELEVIKERIKDYMKVDIKDKSMRPSKKGFQAFWNMNKDNIKERKEFFYSELEPIIKTNYWRKIDKTGNYVDYYRYIDSVFVFIFITEFLLMWRFSIKRYGEDEKVLYPVYHWYDIVSCIPLQQFRFLRLLRVIFVYMRLVKKGIIIPTDNPIKRLIEKYTQIITEELSAIVSLQILTDIEEKTKLGVNKTIIEESIVPHKDLIRNVLVKNIQKISIKLVRENKSNIVDFATMVTRKTILDMPEYKTLHKIPYVKDKIEQIISEKNLSKMINQHSENITDNLDETLHNPIGEKFLNDLTDAILDEIIDTMKDDVVQDLMEKINLQFIAELKESTSFRKWKLDKELKKKNTDKLVENKNI